MINGDGECSFIAAYIRAYGSSRSAWSKGRQPPGRCSASIAWTGWTLSVTGHDDTIINIVLVLLGRPERQFPDGLMFYRRCFLLFFRHEFSEVPRPIALKLCHMVGIWLNFIIPLQKFGELSPKKIWGQKHAKFRSIFDHFRLWSRISPERLEISKIGRRYKLWQFLLRLTKKVRWTLVH